MNKTCMIAAAICFALSAFPAVVPGINFMGAGLFCVTLAWILK